MNNLNKSDRELSVTSSEIVWDFNDYTYAHRFVIPPILRHLERHKVRTILDLGCGNGILTGLLADRGYDITGLDVSNSGIEIARKNYPGIPFYQQDVSEPIPETYAHCNDAVIAVVVIEHLLLLRRLLENAVIALRPMDLLLLITSHHGYLKNLALALTNKFDYHWHPLRGYDHVKFFSQQTILSLVSEFGLSDVTFETVGRIPLLARSMIITGVWRD